jgi:nucleoside-diphosphate-sugar epimerase
VCDPDQVEAILRQVRPDTIFHLAGFASGSRSLSALLRSFRVDLFSTVSLLAAATAVGCRRVLVTGSLEEPTCLESVPTSPYAASKAAGTQYARLVHSLFGTPVVVVRIFMTYGPGQPPEKLIPYAIRELLAGRRPQLISPRRLVDWVYVDDVIDALIAAASADGVEGRILDIGSGHLESISQVVEMIRHLTGVDLATDTVPGGEEERSEVVRAADVEATFAAIGWRATTVLQEGLRRTLASHRV